MKHTPGPWQMKPGDSELREGWSIEAPSSPHPFGAEYSREDNVVGSCCSAGVYREEDARLIVAAPDLLQHLKYMVMLAERLGPGASEVHREEALALCRGTIRDAEEIIAKAEGMAQKAD